MECNYCGEQHDEATRAQCDAARLEAERTDAAMADDDAINEAIDELRRENPWAAVRAVSP